jgi:hypothetical protein
MTAFSNRLSLAAFVLANVIVVTIPLAAAQRGPSKTKMPPLSAEQQASSKDKAKQQPKAETRRTPFGEAKSATKTDDAPPVASTSPFIEVEEKGDTVIFQRRTPFGPQEWRKKRSDLTPQEEEMLRAHQAKQLSPDSGNDKPEPASPNKATSREAPNTTGQDREKQ